MLSVFRFGVAVLLVAGWGLAALSLHVVRTPGGVQLITKNKLSIDDTWVDVRAWSSADEDKHPVLYTRLQQLEQTELLDPVPARSSDDNEQFASRQSAKESWARLNREAALRRR